MAMKEMVWRGSALLAILLVLTLFGCSSGSDDNGDGDADGDGDTTPTDGDDDAADGDADGDQPVNHGPDEEAMRAVLEDVIVAFTSGTEASVDSKLAPHMSEAYAYAGCDKGIRVELYKQQFAAEGGALVEVAIQETTFVYPSDTEASLTATLEASSPVEVDGISVQGQGIRKLTLDFRKEGDTWRIMAIKSGTFFFFAAGGVFSTDSLSNLTFDPAELLQPGTDIDIAGMVTIPEVLQEGATVGGAITMEWDTREDNPETGGVGAESYWDFPKNPTGAVSIDVSLPSGGVGADTLPDLFQKGRDTVTIQLNVAVIGAGEPGDTLGFIYYGYEIPLVGFQNE
ncbi:MAG: hypothetical protein C4523_05975 [Myxococcales bacterium]|nr:MAG: hypothetical protein C4523_05975 [Myxococcales bacterium]